MGNLEFHEEFLEAKYQEKLLGAKSFTGRYIRSHETHRELN